MKFMNLDNLIKSILSKTDDKEATEIAISIDKDGDFAATIVECGCAGTTGYGKTAEQALEKLNEYL